MNIKTYNVNKDNEIEYITYFSGGDIISEREDVYKEHSKHSYDEVDEL